MEYKENIFIDVDGVLLDFTGHFISYYNKIHNTNFKYEDAVLYDLTNLFMVSEEELLVDIRQYCLENNNKYIPYYDLSLIEQFNKLDNYNKIIITAASKKGKDNRVFNLREFNYDKLIFSKYKANFYQEYKPRYIFEDFENNIDYYIKVIDKEYTIIMIPNRPWTNNLKIKYKDLNYIKFYDDKKIGIL